MSGPLVVKVCGFTREEDVRAATAAGVDWLGFNLWPGSKRARTPEQVRALVRAMPRSARAVGIFVDATPAEAFETASLTGLDMVQLHGSEQAGAWDDFPLPVIKALRVDGAGALAEATAWRCEALLLDAPGPQPGGNGTRFDWALATRLAQTRRVLVAGGLTPENVAGAVRTARPFGVDVASGVESSPGIKDAERMARFAATARSARE